MKADRREWHWITANANAARHNLLVSSSFADGNRAQIDDSFSSVESTRRLSWQRFQTFFHKMDFGDRWISKWRRLRADDGLLKLHRWTGRGMRLVEQTAGRETYGRSRQARRGAGRWAKHCPANK